MESEGKHSDHQKESNDDSDESRETERRNTSIRIDTNAIPCISCEEQDDELRRLGITAYHQSVYEEGVMLQVDEALRVSHDTRHTSTDRLRKLLCVSDSDNHSKGHTLNHQRLTDNSKSAETQISHERATTSNAYNEVMHCDNYDMFNASKKLVKNFKKFKREIDSEEECKSVDEVDDDWLPSDNDFGSDEQEVESDFNDNNEGIDFESELDCDSYAKRKRKKVHHFFKAKTESKSKARRIDKIADDGNENCFKKRINEYKKQRAKERYDNILPDGSEIKSLDEYIELDDGFRVPKKLWDQLFAYQQTGVHWLWELHKNGCGGIVGDEMGLGKTIQMIAFLCGLMSSKFHNFRDLYTSLGPVILICPATIMHQWVAEFHKWWPYFRVAILHQTGTYAGKKESLIRIMNRANGILITSYSSVCKYQKVLLKYDWHYVILDEGHKIRNPDAQITLACKLFNTPHRLILSGSPIQNNLRELWSLFDFVYPGKLGTLNVFMEHFAVPITQGGYANATQVQIQVAYKCATVLRDSIKPYLLRRVKEEVKSNLVLPNKNEQVLFCKLTDEQRELYKSYLDSSTVRDIFRGSTQIFVGLINLRKICNHPHIFSPSLAISDLNSEDDDNFGYYKKSGKMIVVEALLRLWYSQEHKVLLFTQSRQMLRIMENFVKHRKYNYLMMDGTTAVKSRQCIIKQFNEDKNIFLFLLTTRVGGIGVNLTGANRVLIYDPDWNPSTDMQARERCWRIGQNKNVTIYRLLSAGTIEEKIYHRQIFKQYLTNRVLKDPKQRRFFKTNDLHELFTLGSDSNTTESSALFAGTDSEVKVNHKAKRVATQKDQRNDVSLPASQLKPEKIAELREKAKALSKMIAEKFANNTNCVQNDVIKQNEKNDNDLKPLSKELNFKNHTNNKEPKIKKAKKGVKFEGKRIKYLLKQDVYRETSSNFVNNNEDDYVLKKLFKRSKVHSALQHDAIESTSTPDFALAEREAELVANQSINALKRSRELSFVANSNIHASLLSQSKKFGQKSKTNSFENKSSSSSLLKDMKDRNRFQNEIEANNGNEGNELLSTPVNTEYDSLLADIRSFIAFQSQSNGEATTEELLSAFKSKLAPHQSAAFKALLWQLCEFYRRSDKVGVWKLKAEFR